MNCFFFLSGLSQHNTASRLLIVYIKYLLQHIFKIKVTEKGQMNDAYIKAGFHKCNEPKRKKKEPTRSSYVVLIRN